MDLNISINDKTANIEVYFGRFLRIFLAMENPASCAGQDSFEGWGRKTRKMRRPTFGKTHVLGFESLSQRD